MRGLNWLASVAKLLYSSSPIVCDVGFDIFLIAVERPVGRFVCQNGGALNLLKVLYPRLSSDATKKKCLQLMGAIQEPVPEDVKNRYLIELRSQ